MRAGRFFRGGENRAHRRVLPPWVTLNNIARPADLYYAARHASTGGWPSINGGAHGASLTYSGSGNAPTFNRDLYAVDTTLNDAAANAGDETITLTSAAGVTVGMTLRLGSPLETVVVTSIASAPVIDITPLPSNHANGDTVRVLANFRGPAHAALDPDDAGSRFFLSPNTTDGEIGTKDGYAEFTLEFRAGSASAFQTISSKTIYPGGTYKGHFFSVYEGTPNYIQFYLYDGTGAGKDAYMATTANVVAGGRYFVSVAWDRSEATLANSGAIYVNGTEAAIAALAYTRPGDVSQAIASRIMQVASGDNFLDSPLGHFALWTHANWHPGGAANNTNWLDLHTRRYRAVMG